MTLREYTRKRFGHKKRRFPDLDVIRRFEFAEYSEPFRLRSQQERDELWKLAAKEGDDLDASVSAALADAEEWLYEHRNDAGVVTEMPAPMLRDFVAYYEHLAERVLVA